jgi:hypothetical protein
VLLWKSGNKDVANNFRIQLQSTTNLYDKHKFHENLKEDYRLDDPFQSNAYVLIVLLGIALIVLLGIALIVLLGIVFIVLLGIV